MGTWVHRLSDVDPASKTGSCAHCGRVRLTRNGNKWRCTPAFCARPAYQRNKRKQNWRRQGIVGMDDSVYAQMLAGQGGQCAICGKPPGEKRLCVDHDHATGAIRGLLCHDCNTQIERLDGLAEWMPRAMEYLKKQKEGVGLDSHPSDLPFTSESSGTDNYQITRKRLVVKSAEGP